MLDPLRCIWNTGSLKVKKNEKIENIPKISTTSVRGNKQAPKVNVHISIVDQTIFENVFNHIAKISTFFF